MHEMALMGDILNIIKDDAEVKQINKISKIELIVGELSNALPDALSMAFEIFKEQNPHFISRNAILHMQIEESKAECIFCETIYKPDQKISICPNCKMPAGKLIAGETFQVLSYEGEK